MPNLKPIACVLLLATVWIPFSNAGEKPGAGAIKIEARGKLKMGIVAIGGETTGNILDTKDGKLELDLSKKNLIEVAEKLKGQEVIVSGTLSIRAGVEVRQRLIVTVTSIGAAKAK